MPDMSAVFIKKDVSYDRVSTSLTALRIVDLGDSIVL